MSNAATFPARRAAVGPEDHEIHYLNRRGCRVWEIPLAGTTIKRRSALLPAIPARGTEPLRLGYEAAYQLAQRLNAHLAAVRLPGKCFAVWVGGPGRIDVMAGCREVYG